MLQSISKSGAPGTPRALRTSVGGLSRALATGKPGPSQAAPSEVATGKNQAVDNEETGKDSKTAHKTMAQLDEEMRLKMSGIAGDGGEAGIEYEDGKPVAMKRSVRNNMFRYI